MTDLVQVIDGGSWTTSQVIAEKFNKAHKNVIRSIETLETSEEFNRLNFAPVSYIDSKGEARKSYRLSHNGFMMVAMGFTGKEAVIWKEKFIAAFNEAVDVAFASKRLTAIPQASQVFTALVPVAEAFGFEGNQAKLSAAKATRQVTGIDFQGLLGVTHLIAESQTRHFTATELGARIGMSAIAFNRLLESRGLQEKIDGKWCMTSRGRHLGVLLDTGKKHSNGTPVQQLKWLESVLAEIQGASA